MSSLGKLLHISKEYENIFKLYILRFVDLEWGHMMMPALNLGLRLLQDIRAQNRLCSQRSLVLSFHSKKQYHLFPNNEINKHWEKTRNRRYKIRQKQFQINFWPIIPASISMLLNILRMDLDLYSVHQGYPIHKARKICWSCLLEDCLKALGNPQHNSSQKRP